MTFTAGAVALVTGGTSGLGKATACAFAQYGVKVVIAARNEDAGQRTVHEIRHNGGEALFVQTDVAHSDQVRRLFQTIKDTYGRLDYAFNNAGTYVTGTFAMTADFTEEDFDNTFAVNLRGVWLCMKYEILQMLSREPVKGVIGAPQASLYSATKAGIITLTKSAAQEYAPYGIRVNALLPGAFDTPMLDKALERRSAQSGSPKETLKEAYGRQIPIGHIGKPEQAAEAVLWLCSDAASYVVGHSLIVDGGRSNVLS